MKSTILAQKIEVIGYEDIDIGKIKIDDSIQVRTLKKEADLESLVESIKNIGLIEPIIVSEIKKGKEYNLIAGQRRLLAYRKLGKNNIACKIIEPVDSRTAKLISFGENLQRRDIEYEDRCRVASDLFKLYPGTKQEKLRQVAADLGVNATIIARLVKQAAIPDEVWIMIKQKKISQAKAWQITAALLGNAEKIIAAAKKMAEDNLSNPERENIIKAAKELGPGASIEKILKRSKELPELIKIIIHLEEGIIHNLEIETNKRGFEKKEDLIADIIENFLKEGK